MQNNNNGGILAVFRFAITLTELYGYSMEAVTNKDRWRG